MIQALDQMYPARHPRIAGFNVWGSARESADDD